jgi:hypothetical protein
MNGALTFGECRAFPTSCKTCACATTDFNQILGPKSSSCTSACYTTAGHVVGQNETSDDLVVSCMVP